MRTFLEAANQARHSDAFVSASLRQSHFRSMFAQAAFGQFASSGSPLPDRQLGYDPVFWQRKAHYQHGAAPHSTHCHQRSNEPPRN